MMPLDDLTNSRFGRLLVLELASKPPTKWKCLCDCGTIKIIRSGSLKNGISTSCGCFRKEFVSAVRTTHGMRKTNEWKTWAAMKQRCKPDNKDHGSYYDRGIDVCDRWLTSFENFIQDMGPKPKGYSIDRIDNNKGYYPENCRWATRKQQESNKRVTVLLTIDGVTNTQSEWARIFNLPLSTLSKRIKKGWDAKAACTLPRSKFIRYSNDRKGIT